MRWFILLVGLSLGTTALHGCAPPREPPPVTQKVEGRVVYPDGRPFTTGGTIVFTHQTMQGISCSAEIKQDGTFTLHSITAHHKVAGAPEGVYSVIVNPMSTSQENNSIALTKSYTVAVGENDLTIVIDN